MQRTYELKSAQTLETMKQLRARGIQKMAVILRHSQREFSETAAHEPFMGLTPDGRTFAFDMGRALPSDTRPRIFSSFFGRCIETAYLLDKGYTREHGIFLDHNITEEPLAPFYIKDIERAVTRVQELGTRDFIREWFDGRIDEDIVINPEKTADMVAGHMAGHLEELKENETALCVSHDWNIFPLKEFKMGLKHEKFGDVGYLEGIVFFKEKGKTFITCADSDPIPL
ncbi:histidine phosphatase family protein [Desulfospira joergensenii]|uniref:histidine phosphatase family protein n=1 Tax=Desulfospira joergensenii TaxID=53329 RepID=UPI0003B68228|nr:histidine phosphatase family protein [Desulfospira joergensenii]